MTHKVFIFGDLLAITVAHGPHIRLYKCNVALQGVILHGQNTICHSAISLKESWYFKQGTQYFLLEFKDSVYKSKINT